MALTAVAATGVLTNTDVVVTTNTVVVGGKTYTFQATLTNVDGNVQMGAAGAVAESFQNLLNAINLTGTPGTDYATLMTKNKQVRCTSAALLVLNVQATVVGTVGNLIASTAGLDNGAWGAVTLENGAGDSDEVALDLAALRTGSTFGINSGVIAELLSIEASLGH